MTSAMWGANPEELNELAQAMGGFASTIEEIDRSLSSSLRTSTWTGVDAEQFQGDWYGLHQPGLTRVATALQEVGAALRHEAQQQVSASAANSAGPVGGPASGTPVRQGSAASPSLFQPEKPLPGVPPSLDRFLTNWGWFSAPFVGNVPVLGALTKADSYARYGQDLALSHDQLAYQEATGIFASTLMDAHTPVSTLAGIDVILAEHCESAARSIDWSDAIHHPEHLNPLQPGGPQAIWQAETSGLEGVAKDIWSALSF
ncbi:MAG TPA: WXG100 family type VII secretion target [Acidimicrobiales bacterium]|nr:WXG100 family type VII secretion target [Acidimicrobiales bacterium]